MARKRFVTCWDVAKSEVRFSSNSTLVAILVGASDLLVPLRWVLSTRPLSLKAGFVSVVTTLGSVIKASLSFFGRGNFTASLIIY